MFHKTFRIIVFISTAHFKHRRTSCFVYFKNVSTNWMNKDVLFQALAACLFTLESSAFGKKMINKFWPKLIHIFFPLFFSHTGLDTLCEELLPHMYFCRDIWKQSVLAPCWSVQRHVCWQQCATSSRNLSWRIFREVWNVCSPEWSSYMLLVNSTQKHCQRK